VFVPKGIGRCIATPKAAALIFSCASIFDLVMIKENDSAITKKSFSNINYDVQGAVPKKFCFPDWQVIEFTIKDVS